LDIQFCKHEQGPVDAAAVALPHDVALPEASLQMFELEQNGAMVLNALDHFFLMERSHSLEVLLLDSCFKLQHPLPLVSVAEQTEAMQEHPLAQEYFAFDEELRRERICMHEIGQLFDEIVRDIIDGIVQPER
jgi:hypothetical protein